MQQVVKSTFMCFFRLKMCFPFPMVDSAFSVRFPRSRKIIVPRHCTIPARAPCEGRSPHGLRTISARRLRRLDGNCTDIAQFPYNLCTVSVRIYPGLPPRPRRRNCTMPVDNVNTYAVARSHLRCPKNCTERQIYRTASGQM